MLHKEVLALLEELREAVWRMNQALPKLGLVTMTGGNVSGLDRARGYVAIKPSGVDYEQMRPEDIVITDLEGKTVEGKLRPSVDLENHLYLYVHREDIGGIVHTHSSYATSFAALGEPIPACLTAIADEFGGDIPCSAYASNEADRIGQAILDTMGKGPAVLLKHHGVWGFGATPEAAVKAAAMVEDAAKTCHLAMLRGTPERLPPEEIEKWWNRYHGWYGQPEV